MTDETIEQEIQAKGKTAPRVTPADIDANIASEHYFTAGEGVIGAFAAGEFGSHSGSSVTLRRDMAAPKVLKPSLNLLTFCVLVLRNGFTVTGESACASPENFDAEIGRKVARANAVTKMWPLMGYALKQSLHDEPTAAKPKPYTWADVVSHQTNNRNFDRVLDFKIQMQDGCFFEGSIPTGLKWPESASAMLAQCNRMRTQHAQATK
jgi:hypothetical protein